MQRTLSIDLETYSEIDIAKCGSFRYIDDESFEILLLGYAFDDEPVTVIDLTADEEVPADFLAALYDPEVTKTAWNCAFERFGLWKHFGRYCPPEQWSDTMILSAVCGLPLGLGEAGKALRLEADEAKDREGKALIRYFCSPCRPTKVNGGRTRNLPQHDTDKWALFIEYNRQDVVAERTIRKRLLRWEPDSLEHRFWCLDARINERGMRVDRELVHNAIAMDARYKAELTEQAVAISGLENPNSVAQIKQWLLEQEGIEVPSLNKKVVAEVVSQLNGERAKQFMALRARLAKSSTKKYEAMERSACADAHIKGCFQFYGANRTGRFAGRLVQLQNLPQNHMEDLAVARSLVRDNDYETVRLLYDSVSDTLSELIRTALIPEPGHRFIVADFSAIEARVIAWIAGEQWRLDVFRNGGDIYCRSASAMFKVPVEKHGINGHLRQKGKVAELACIAEGQLVLTDQGCVPIEQVTPDMKLWDGVGWVHHGGVVCNGTKEVLTYAGLTATADHIVWAEIAGAARPVHFGFAAACGAHLLQTGDGGQAIRLDGSHQPGKALESKVESLLCADQMPWVRRSSVAESEQSAGRKVQRLPDMLSTAHGTALVRKTLYRGQAAMHKPKRRQLQKLRRTRNQILLSERDSGGPVHDRKVWLTRSRTGDRPNKRQWKLRAWKSALGHTSRELSEPAPVSRKVRVYDIKNAGPRHRFTVSNVLVHNCGYGGGVSALKAFGADKLGMTEEEMVNTVDLWRESSPRICALWRALERAAIRCVVHKTPQVSAIGGIRFEMECGILWMTLPSGRRIAYYGAEYGPSKFHRDRRALSYMGVDQKTKRWGRVETWGGKLAENVTQATARDCLRDTMLALEDAGYDIRAHVHDEVIISEPRDGRTVEDVSAIMGRELPWASGLPLRGDGYACDFYMKD